MDKYDLLNDTISLIENKVIPLSEECRNLIDRYNNQPQNFKRKLLLGDGHNSFPDNKSYLIKLDEGSNLNLVKFVATLLTFDHFIKALNGASKIRYHIVKPEIFVNNFQGLGKIKEDIESFKFKLSTYIKNDNSYESQVKRIKLQSEFANFLKNLKENYNINLYLGSYEKITQESFSYNNLSYDYPSGQPAKVYDHFFFTKKYLTIVIDMDLDSPESSKCLSYKLEADVGNYDGALLYYNKVLMNKEMSKVECKELDEVTKEIISQGSGMYARFSFNYNIFYELGDNVTLFNLYPKDAHENYKEFFDYSYSKENDPWPAKEPYFIDKRYSNVQKGTCEWDAQFSFALEKALNTIITNSPSNPILKKLDD